MHRLTNVARRHVHAQLAVLVRTAGQRSPPLLQLLRAAADHAPAAPLALQILHSMTEQGLFVAKTIILIIALVFYVSCCLSVSLLLLQRNPMFC